MRLSTLQPSLYRTADFGHPAGRAPAPQSSLADRNRGHRQMAERVFEGEIVPRPMAAEQLLETPRTAPLSAPVPATAAPDAISGALTAKSLFYLLHSSAERLSADPLGHNIDQFV